MVQIYAPHFDQFSLIELLSTRVHNIFIEGSKFGILWALWTCNLFDPRSERSPTNVISQGRIRAGE